MKKIFLIVAGLGFASCVDAQTLEEWTQQKKTQIKYLLQQIAANQAYIHSLQKGYNIAKTGLQSINDIKHGDFNLHRDFFNSLRDINPAIKNFQTVADIVTLQAEIINDTRSLIKNIRASGQFTPAEITYVKNASDHLLSQCANDIDALIETTTQGETAINDAERIKIIGGIYKSMQDKFSFCKSFSQSVALLAMQRSREKMETEVSRKLRE